ncbi:MAG TPA: PAS domain S-box protein, partial [Bryobacteraceae bacterium]|nr:PAS domain S-box protein [Bryobacteraceae bacterium]
MLRTAGTAHPTTRPGQATGVPYIPVMSGLEGSRNSVCPLAAFKCLSATQPTLESARSAFLNAAIAMSVIDVTGRYICVNRALCELTGYSEEELLATNFQSIVYAGDLKDSLALLHRLLAGPETNAVSEMRYRRRDGGTVWV